MNALRTTIFSTCCACIATLASIGTPQTAFAQSVSFLVDPDTIDANMDGFITDNEFQPVATDGTIFSLVPTDNLTGSDRFLLSELTGLQYGGGGGSTLTFDFSVSRDISLESYTLADSGFFLSNPSFNISEGGTVLSSTNTSNSSGDTHNFNGGPIDLTAGTVYSFETQINGAAVQAFLGSFSFSATAVPEPGSAGILAVGAIVLSIRRRRN